MTDSARTEVDGLLRRLLGRSGPELGCEQCFDELDRYVELELGGADADAATPGMRLAAIVTGNADRQREATGEHPGVRIVDSADALFRDPSAFDLVVYPFVSLTRLALPHLERSGRGRVVVVASSSVREPIDELALSNMTRPAVIGWLKTLSREMA